MGFSRKGITLSLGLISEQVKLTGAVDKSSGDEQLKTLCVGMDGTEHAPSAISSKYHCPTCGDIHDRTQLKKGRPSGDGFVVVNPEDLNELKADTSEQFKKEVSLTAHPAEQVLNGTVSGDKRYYLQPEAAGQRFAVIRSLIADNPQYAFLAQYTVSARVSTYMARVEGDAILLEERTPAALLPAPQIEAEPNEAMLEMAEQLLGTLVTDFDASNYADTYTERLREMLDAAEVTEGDTTTPVVAAAPKQSKDDALMAALEAQLKAAKSKPKKRASTARTRKAS